eukprot:CAMPEP_0116139856 /NCGR_PEP_ID=MMETSP0329-20121206/13532_1 /TAXON_ID=697910 /ORGANISM="Pseudo-nitzschia arenysensis, Strain B593" /LENGTH=336 /DNA_ID=CAMNT_0003634921 /DNA_START=83 /DNA_END=1093 /DNA_ORIENTATION=+
MQSISASYSTGISVLGFQKARLARSEAANLHWRPSIVKESDLNVLNEEKVEDSMGDCDCDCTLDTSTSSSRSDAMEVEVDNSIHSLSETRIDEDSKNHERNRLKRKRRRVNLRVRFTPGTALEPTTKRVMKKRKQINGEASSDCDPSRWYTKQELKDIQKSCIFAVKTQDFISSMWPVSEGQVQTTGGTITTATLSGDPFLDRFSLQNRKRRKLARWKMNETTKVVKEFEIATGTNAPPELLSELLRNYSKPMEMDAIEWALKMRMSADASDAMPSKSLRNRPETSASFARDVYNTGAGMCVSILSQGLQQPRHLLHNMPAQQSHTNILREQLRGI